MMAAEDADPAVIDLVRETLFAQSEFKQGGRVSLDRLCELVEDAHILAEDEDFERVDNACDALEASGWLAIDDSDDDDDFLMLGAYAVSTTAAAEPVVEKEEESPMQDAACAETLPVEEPEPVDLKTEDKLHPCSIGGLDLRVGALPSTQSSIHVRGKLSPSPRLLHII